MENIGTPLAFTLTLMVFSYLLGDNFLYRLAVYVFAGLAAAYITIVTVQGVLLPLTNPNGDQPGEALLLLVSLGLGLLLLLKATGRFTWLSNLAMAFIVAVGTAVAIVGAVSGTLLPLAAGIGRAGNTTLESIIIFIGVTTSLIYFQYLSRRNPDGTITHSRVIHVLKSIGQGFIVITLGALYGGAILTNLTILSERIGFLLGAY